MNKQQRKQIKNRTPNEVTAIYQRHIDSRDKCMEAIAKHIKANLRD